MYEILSKEDMSIFTNEYFSQFKKDIWKVSHISYGNVIEYLINDHYIFVVLYNFS